MQAGGPCKRRWEAEEHGKSLAWASLPVTLTTCCLLQMLKEFAIYEIVLFGKKVISEKPEKVLGSYSL